MRADYPAVATGVPRDADARRVGTDGAAPAYGQAGTSGPTEALLAQFDRVQQAVIAGSPLDEVFRVIVEGAAKLFGADAVTLRLIDPDEPGTLVVVASHGLDRMLRRRTRRSPVGAGACGRAIEEQRVVVIEDYRLLEARSPIAPPDLRTAMAAPVYEHATLTGVLLVSSRDPERRYSTADGRMLERYAAQATLALGAAKAADQVRQAFRDSLTGLPNRALFLDRLEQSLVRADREGTDVAVLFLDLDSFKPVNDSLGHLAGDEVLIQVARRISGRLRRSDTPARLGGDEFAVLLANGSDPLVVAERLVAALAKPFAVGASEVCVGASVGICRGRYEAEEMLRNADVAMYRAKHSGRGSYVEYEQSMRAAVVSRVEVATSLRGAVMRSELELHYQPIVDLVTGRVAGLEALARWRHPNRGLLLPSEFLPSAEETGFVVEIDRFALRRACADLAHWRSRHGAPDLWTSVHVSAQDILRTDLTAEIRSALGTLAPSQLVLEPTKTVLLRRTELDAAHLDAVQKLGVRLAIDVYGGARGSLESLSEGAGNLLKLPRSLVAGIAGNERRMSIARALVELGAALGFITVAEGLENERDLETLRALGCALGQGYLLGRPAPAELVPELLDATPAAA